MDNPVELKRIAAAVKARRVELGLTQTDLATRAGVQISTVQDYESLSNPRANRQTLVARKVAKALGWKPQAFDLMLAGTDPADVVASEASAATTGNVLDYGRGAVDEELKDQISKLLAGIGALTERVKENDGNVSALTQMHGDQLVRLHQLEARLAEVEARIDDTNR